MRKLMVSISLALIRRRSLTLSEATPSMMISGSVELIEEAPRRFMLQLSIARAEEEEGVLIPATGASRARSGEDRWCVA